MSCPTGAAGAASEDMRTRIDLKSVPSELCGFEGTWWRSSSFRHGYMLAYPACFNVRGDHNSETINFTGSPLTSARAASFARNLTHLSRESIFICLRRGHYSLRCFPASLETLSETARIRNSLLGTNGTAAAQLLDTESMAAVS
ncbi:hypothetical protein BKA93DRAFT_754557 [Sparassis latifolia]